MNLPTGGEKARAVEAMFDRIAQRYDFMNRLMTFGADRVWRRRTIESLRLEPGERVLDLACGTGELAREALACGARVIGLDFSRRMLMRASGRGLGGYLVRADASRLPFRDGAFDAIASGFALRNLADIGAVLRECSRVLAEGGRLALLEVDTPRNPILRTGHRLYFCWIVPLAGRLLADREAYAYLPSSVAYLPEQARLMEMLMETGFTDPARHTMLGGAVQLITARRAS